MLPPRNFAFTRRRPWPGARPATGCCFLSIVSPPLDVAQELLPATTARCSVHGGCCLLHVYSDIFYAFNDIDDSTTARFRAELGLKIRRARRSADLTQRGLAGILGIDQPQISKWERARSIPTLLQLVAVALACGQRPEMMVEGIIAPTREQLSLRLDPETSRLLYEVTTLVVRGAGETRQPR